MLVRTMGLLVDPVKNCDVDVIRQVEKKDRLDPTLPALTSSRQQYSASRAANTAGETLRLLFTVV